MKAASAGAGAAVVVGGAMRRYWRGREVRQQAAFRDAVQDVVDVLIADVIRLQTDFERRQGAHLDRQDRAIESLRQALNQQRNRRDR